MFTMFATASDDDCHNLSDDERRWRVYFSPLFVLFCTPLDQANYYDSLLARSLARSLANDLPPLEDSDLPHILLVNAY